jgi:cutinase
MGSSESEHSVEVGGQGSANGTRRWILRLLVATAAATVASLHMLVYSPRAAAAPCPDVQVVFARGTFEPAGVGVTGQAFVDALRAQLPGKSIDVYPVNYPASLDFARAADGVADASTKVQSVATACPKTKMVLGGYSQGAAVIAYITTDTIPPDFALPAGISGPMPAAVAPHVAAVTLFGKPSSGFLNMLDANAPPIAIGHAYTAKALDLCVTDDPVCSGQGGDLGAHALYAVNGMADQAATFATDHVSLKT